MNQRTVSKVLSDYANSLPTKANDAAVQAGLGRYKRLVQWVLSDPQLHQALNYYIETEVKACGDRPRVVCLCGSTRFFEAFMQANYEETMAGRIVLSVGFFMHRPDTAHSQALGCTPEQKIALDELHKRKIDLADEVLVLNVEGYIGSSTRSEIEYAVAHSKPIRYLVPPDATAKAGGGE